MILPIALHRSPRKAKVQTEESELPLSFAIKYDSIALVDLAQHLLYSITSIFNGDKLRLSEYGGPLDGLECSGPIDAARWCNCKQREK